MNEKFYPVVLVELSEEDGSGYAAYAPDLTGCMGDGDTPEDALSDLEDAKKEWFAEMERLGRPIPAPGSTIATRVQERKNLFDLLKKQQALIGTQEKAIEEMREQLEAVLRSEDENECREHEMWRHPGHVVFSAVGVTRRRDLSH